MLSVVSVYPRLRYDPFNRNISTALHKVLGMFHAFCEVPSDILVPLMVAGHRDTCTQKLTRVGAGDCKRRCEQRLSQVNEHVKASCVACFYHYLTINIDVGYSTCDNSAARSQKCTGDL